MPEITSAKLSIQPELLPLGRGARALDVGCGDGRHIAAAAGRGCFAVGVDYDAGELAKARARLGGTRVDLIAGDASRLPFRDGAFDAVICTETLEHLPDDAGAMREIARVLADDGTLHGAVPSHFTEVPYFMLSRGYRDAPGGHVRIYAPARLFGKLAGAGLRVTDMRYVHFVDSLVWLRYCLTDFLRPQRKPRTDFEAAVMLAVAAERPVATWRTRLREAIAESRFIAVFDALGAFVWPKSLTFVAVKTVGENAGRKEGQIITGQHDSFRDEAQKVAASSPSSRSCHDASRAPSV
jgi:ubiquinone/menaquinone biosynthesis C-methylase UbiE